MSTARTLGVYIYMLLKGAPTSSNDLARAFGGDRKTYLKDLQTLVEAGLATMSTQVINGRPVTVTLLKDESPLNGLQILLSGLNNSSLLLNAYSYISKKEYIRERMENKTMNDEYEPSPMYLEPEEAYELTQKIREKRRQEYLARKEQDTANRIQARKEKVPELWSSDDSCYYFAERVSSNWRIKPWTVARTRFKAAMGQNRKIHGTTGDIEKQMIDRFFDTLEHQKSMDDPEIIWRSFIKQYATLHIEVTRTIVTDEMHAADDELVKKQWGD